MSINIYAPSLDLHGNNLKLLAEKLRKNWMQKLSGLDQTDDSLTSLTWLYDANPISMNLEAAAHYDGQEMNMRLSLYDNYNKYSCNVNQPITGSLLDPKVRLEYRTKWTGKPPFSYATLICLAMRELGKPKVTLSDIYGWIMNNFAYYRHTDSSWQNSVRHNLSLNKCFEKVPRDKGERGKGGFWRVNPRHIDWLEANLAKCRRAAPPPGPPPPIPRSMLLQQRKMQQKCQYQQALLPRNLMLSPSSVSMGNPVTATSFNTNICISESPTDPVKTHHIAALSPSSNSSLSSSPLSFPSVGSPASLQSARIPQTPGHAAYPNGVHTFIMNRSIHSEVNNSSTLPPLSLSVNISQSYLPQTMPCHRRKSPLFKNHLQESIAQNVIFESDDGFSDNEISQSLIENNHSTTNVIHKSPNIHPKLNVYDPNHSECLRKTRMNNNSNMNSVSYKTQPLLRNSNDNNDTGLLDQQSDYYSSCKPKSKASLDKSRINNRNSITERLKRSKSKQTIKQCGSTETKALPTRVLPPRQRYSRWSLPRPYPVTESNLESSKQENDWEDKSILETTDRRKEKKQDKNKGVEWDYGSQLQESELSPLLNYIENDNHNNDDNTNFKNDTKASHNHWSLLNKVENRQVDTICNYMNTELRKTEVVKSDNLSSCDLYKDYCLPNHNTYYQSLSDQQFQYSSHFMTTNSTETTGLSGSLSNSPSSVFCCHSNNTNLYCSSTNSLHSSSCDTQENQCSPHNNNNINNNNNNGLRISHSIVEPEYFINDSTEKTHFLSKKTDNNFMNTPSTVEKSKLPTWASVFLSDDDQNELDCLFTDSKHNDESFNLFSNESFESGIHSSSTLHSSPISLSSPTSSALQSSSCSLTTSSFLFKKEKKKPDSFVSSFKQPTDSTNIRSSNDVSNNNNNNNNPFLEELALDSVDFNFDSINELVESNEHIPLDIDFNLTASFNNDNFLDSSDSLSHEWNNSSLTINTTTNNNTSDIPDSLLCNKAHQQKQPQWPENLAAENDIMPLQESMTNESQWLNDTQTFNASNGLTMFLSEASVQMFEENFHESV
ncbi:unnamed protein product [Schistosoma turkestanicum]|nr:unnamed protein product [Schistosoma turkestanicum]